MNLRVTFSGIWLTNFLDTTNILIINELIGKYWITKIFVQKF